MKLRRFHVAKNNKAGKSRSETVVSRFPGFDFRPEIGRHAFYPFNRIVVANLHLSAIILESIIEIKSNLYLRLIVIHNFYIVPNEIKTETLRLISIEEIRKWNDKSLHARVDLNPLTLSPLATVFGRPR